MHYLLPVCALVFALCHSAVAQSGETNAPKYKPHVALRNTQPDLKDRAAAHERAGRKREAAAIYELMARTNATTRKVVSHRLVTLYAETGETNKALAWAQEVMRENPDPQAYLAAVHARLGQFKPAQQILERELATNTSVRRAVTLRWQLAEVCEKAGENTKASKVLGEAAAAAKGTPMEITARKRGKARP